MSHRILLVEDADTLREVVATLLQTQGYHVDAFASAEAALPALQSHSYACILADFKLPQKNGIELLKEVRAVSPSVPFLLMTAFGSVEIAVQAMKHGANDFITKPFEPEHLSRIIKEVIEHKRIVDRSAGLMTRRERQFLSQDEKVHAIISQARKVARVDSSVLILGESGTGKELLARFIHEQSARREKPFVAVNCAAIPPELLESELFGHAAGAFTGATQNRVGLFQIASEGTIFLDEIGDMPAQLQVKLLRALQEQEIRPLGSPELIRVTPRVVCATNIDIETALSSGSLRDDFYYRIAVVTFTIPPLRQRQADIAMLAESYIDYFCAKQGRERLPLDPTASDLLLAYHWPGNARELENVIERAVILADTVIHPRHLGIELKVDFSALSDAAISLSEISHRAAQAAETEVILKVLEQTRGNKSKAARILGVSYKTLLNKIKEYGLSTPDSSAEAGEELS
jgi:DNA-binding NtrC family response regulator